MIRLLLLSILCACSGPKFVRAELHAVGPCDSTLTIRGRAWPPALEIEAKNDLKDKGTVHVVLVRPGGEIVKPLFDQAPEPTEPTP